MATVYTNQIGQNYKQAIVNAAADVVQLGQLLTWGQIGIQITGTFVGTLVFEITVDGTTFNLTTVLPEPTGAGVTSATAPGLWTKQNTGFCVFQVRVSAYTSGTAVVSIRSLPGQV